MSTILMEKGSKMINFEELKLVLKDKWLDYYEVHQDWIKEMMLHHSGNTPDKGRRPDSSFILGVVTALELKIKEPLFYFFTVSRDRDSIINALGLNFDPEKELEKRQEERTSRQNSSTSNADLEYLNQIREKLTKDN